MQSVLVVAPRAQYKHIGTLLVIYGLGSYGTDSGRLLELHRVNQHEAKLLQEHWLLAVQDSDCCGMLLQAVHAAKRVC